MLLLFQTVLFSLVSPVLLHFSVNVVVRVPFVSGSLSHQVPAQYAPLEEIVELGFSQRIAGLLTRFAGVFHGTWVRDRYGILAGVWAQKLARWEGLV